MIGILGTSLTRPVRWEPLRHVFRPTLGCAMACISFGISAPGSAAPSQAGSDPPLRRVSFLSVPQVEGRGFKLAGEVTTAFDTNFRRTVAPVDALRISPVVEAAYGTTIGRQQFTIGGVLGRDMFLNNGQFNRNRYAIGAGLGVTAGTRCTGNLGVELSERQLLQSDAVELADNLRKEFLTGASLTCQAGVGLGFGATGTYQEVRNSRAQRELFDSNILTISPQITYASPVLGVFSVGGSLSRVRYPSRFVLATSGPVQDGVDIRSGRLGFSRNLGTRLNLNVGASYYDAAPDPQTILVTGALVPLDRVKFSGSGYDASLIMQLGSRATITASADRALRGGGNVGSLLTVANSYGLDMDYRLTPALTLGFGGTLAKQDYRGSFTSPDEFLPRISDSIKRVYAQIGYSPTPRLAVSVEVAHQERDSNPEIFRFRSTSGLLRLRVMMGRG